MKAGWASFDGQKGDGQKGDGNTGSDALARACAEKLHVGKPS
jgi:hypothetical protein